MEAEQTALPSRWTFPAALVQRSVPWDKLRWCTALLVGGIYLASIRTHWWPTSDSALYLMLSDSLILGEGYTLWGRLHAHVPPGFPLILAALKSLGLGSMWCLNACMVAMGLATIWVCYKVLLTQTSKELALLVTAALAYSHAMHFASIRILSDVPYMLLVWVGIVCYLRGLARGGLWLEAGTLALLASCAIRAAGIPLAAGAAVGLVLQPSEAPRRRVRTNAVALVGLPIAAAVAALAYYYHGIASGGESLPNYGDGVTALLGRSVWQWFTEPAKDFYLTSMFLTELFNGQRHELLGPLIALVWIPTLVGMGMHLRRRQWLTVLVTAGYCGGILLQRHMIVRYLLPVAPLLMLYFCEGVGYLAARWKRLRGYQAQAALVCASLLIAAHLPKTIGFLYQVHQRGPTRLAGLEHPLRQATVYLRDAAQPGQKFISTSQARVLSYLSQVPSIPVRNCRGNHFRNGDFDRWFEQGVVFAVVVRDEDRSYPLDVPTREFIKHKKFERVFETEGYCIYRMRGLSGRPAPQKAKTCDGRADVEGQLSDPGEQDSGLPRTASTACPADS